MWESREFSIWSFCIWRINMSRESVIGAGWHCEPLLCECLSSAAGFKMWELVHLCYKLSLPGIQQDFQILTVTWLQLCLVLCDLKSKKWDDGADEEEVFWPVLCLSQVKEMWMFWLTSCVTSKRFKKKKKKTSPDNQVCKLFFMFKDILQRVLCCPKVWAFRDTITRL